MRIHRPSVLVLLALLAVIICWFHFQRQSAGLLAQIHEGMTQLQVEGLIGPPKLKLSHQEGEEWHYSSLRFPDMSVYFDTNAVVRHLAYK
jgi:outer membrane protein assembly factor BamE (lipoprotein component of BamABCDE complex)